MSDVPTILAVFANYPNVSPLHLQSLEEELDTFSEMLDELDADNRLRGKIKDIRDKEGLMKFVKMFKANARLFHYGGHANTLSLDTVQTKMPIDNFVEYISLCPKLKVVVLNGCSTRGFVKRLIERTSVQAVIATNFEVGDAACQKFSAEFYDLLLKQGLNLETAFVAAVSNFTKDQEFNPEKNIYRLDKQAGTITGITALAPLNPGQATRASVKINNLLDQEEKAVPWGLYITDEQTLGWQIYNCEADTDNQKAALLKQKEALVPQKLAKEIEIEKIKGLINSFKEGPEGDEARADTQNQLTEKEAELSNIIMKYNKVVQGLAALSATMKEEMIVQQFSESFFELNYIEQIKIAYNINKKKKFRGFILQGTPECAVNLLARRLIKILGIHETTVIQYNYDSKFRRDGWEGLNIQLELNIKNHDPDGIVKEMVRLYRKTEPEGATQKGYLLLFRNSSKDDFSKKAVREDIFRFWQDLIERFEAEDGDRPFDHPIYLFLLDGNCGREPNGNGFKSGRQKEYDEDTAVASDTVEVYPIVQPLTERTISDWQMNKGFAVNLIFEKQEIDELLNRSERFFLPAVQQMSGLRVMDPNRKLEAYRRFRESNVDNDFSKEI